MKILAIDSSAKTAGVAVTQDAHLLSSCFVNAGLTHSRTLMAMVDHALRQADLKIEDVDAFAVNAGPGSFTGVRIGVAAVKGLASVGERPCAGVSTLESIAYNFCDTDAVICAAMDARCGQVYTALFSVKHGVVTRLTQDAAMPATDLAALLKAYDAPIYFAGDGASVAAQACGDLPNGRLADESRRFQNAYGVARAALISGSFDAPDRLTPAYLRLPQAERELRIKKGESV